MKRKTADEMTQSAIRLPRSLHERLQKAGGDRGMGEEIRRRLQASFDAEEAVPATQQTRELLDAISFFDDEMFYEFGSWSKEPFAFEVLKACVDMLLMNYRPEGEAKPRPKPKRDADGKPVLLYGHGSPEEIARLMVHFWMRRKAERAKEEKRQ